MDTTKEEPGSPPKDEEIPDDTSMDKSVEVEEIVPLKGGDGHAEEVKEQDEEVKASLFADDTTGSGIRPSTSMGSLDKMAREIGIDLNQSSWTSTSQGSDKRGGSSSGMSILMGDETDDETALLALNQLRTDLELADNAHNAASQSYKPSVNVMWDNSTASRAERRSSYDSFTSDDFGAYSTDGEGGVMSVNTADEVDMLMNAVGRNEHNEEKRTQELEARARQAEANGDLEEAQRIRQSMEVKAKVLETRRSAVELLKRAVTTTSNEVGSIIHAMESNEKNEEKRLRDLEAQVRRAEDMGDEEEAQRLRESLEVKSKIMETRRSAAELLKRAVSTTANRASRTSLLQRASSERDHGDDSNMMFPASSPAPAGPPYSAKATQLAKGEWAEEDASQVSSIAFLGDVYEESTVGPPEAIAAPTRDIVNISLLASNGEDVSGDKENIQDVSNQQNEETSPADKKKETSTETYKKAPDPPGMRTVHGLPFGSGDSTDSDFPIVHTEDLSSSDEELEKINSSLIENDSKTQVDEEDRFGDDPSRRENEQTGTDKELSAVVSPEATSGTRKRRIIMGVAIAAAVIGGVVAALSGSKDDDRNVPMSPTIAPSPAPTMTRHPTMPTVPPLRGERFNQLVDLFSSALYDALDITQPPGFEQLPVFPSTPAQTQALVWLADEDPFQMEIGWDTADRLIDRYVLAMWVLSRDDPDALTLDDGTGAPWMSEWDVCFWEGITCSDGKTAGVDAFRVERVDLTSTVGGTIPSEFAWMTALTDLSLSTTGLTGTLPTQLGELTRLTSLVLHYNDFEGPIPSEIGRLIGLRELHLDNNRLTGTIPGDFHYLDVMTDLNLSINQLTGLVPTFLQDIGRDGVDVSGNSFAACEDYWYIC